MPKVRRRKKVSLWAWGVIGAAGFILFALANFAPADDDSYLMAGAGLLVLLVAVAGHNFTCSLIERVTRGR